MILKEEPVIWLGYPSLRIDLLTSIDNVNFKDYFPNRKRAKWFYKKLVELQEVKWEQNKSLHNRNFTFLFF
jgi:hypothetical protein